MARGEKFTVSLREASGALGDLGTLLPLMLGSIAVAGLAPLPVLLGFAAFYLATAFYYRLPIPVQPMKAVAAVLLTAELGAAEVAASGVMLGAILLALGLTGWISRLGRLVPQSVLAGLQLGLGLAMALMSLELMATAPLVAAPVLMVLLALVVVPAVPAALVALVLAVLLTALLDAPGMAVQGGGALPFLAAWPIPWPTGADIERAATQMVLPQMALTVTNAVLLTALVAGDYFGPRAAHVTPSRLCVSSGLANLLLAPLGALPMCHGAGGLAAHHRFGARSGTAPLLLGLALLLVAVLPSGLGLVLLAAIPVAGLGALLFVAGGELALTRRLFDSKPSCWPVIATTAAATLWVDPFWGLLAGSAAECLRLAIVRLVWRKGARHR